MTTLRWRGTDPYEIEKPLRALIRQLLPAKGRVVTDIDLHVRYYTPSNRAGTFRMIESKNNYAELGFGQEMSFRQMHTLWREADPLMEQYLGFYLIHPSDPEWPQDMTVTVTSLFENYWQEVMPRDRFFQWLDGA